jgi:hypothetical protein
MGLVPLRRLVARSGTAHSSVVEKEFGNVRHHHLGFHQRRRHLPSEFELFEPQEVALVEAVLRTKSHTGRE